MPALYNRTVVEKGDHEGICLDTRHEYSDPATHADCVGVEVRQAVSSRVEDLDKGEAKYYVKNPSATVAISSKAVRLFFTSDVVFITEVSTPHLSKMKRAESGRVLILC